MIHPGDSAGQQALALSGRLGGHTVVTTHEVMTEVLAFFSGAGFHARRIAVQAIRDALEDSTVMVLPQSEASFRSGLELYEKRLDKGYSLTDCVSMNAMRQLSIGTVLTNDHHFRQEGFRILLDPDS
jgi:predicted nucleic acid-binding protein